MSIFDRARTEKTGFRYHDRIRPTEVEFSATPTGRFRDTIDGNAEWSVSITVRQNYWANQAQEESYRNAALRAAAQSLYQDVHRYLPHLELCIASGDREGALQAISDIRKELTP